MPNTFVVIVCGGRDYANRERVFHTLDALHAEHPIAMLVNGLCPTGADRLAREWAKARCVHWRGYQADWAKYGRSAGPKRNAWMLRDSEASLVVAFPGGRGTSHMVRCAIQADVPVITVSDTVPIPEMDDAA